MRWPWLHLGMLCAAFWASAATVHAQDLPTSSDSGSAGSSSSAFGSSGSSSSGTSSGNSNFIPASSFGSEGTPTGSVPNLPGAPIPSSSPGTSTTPATEPGTPGSSSSTTPGSSSTTRPPASSFFGTTPEEGATQARPQEAPTTYSLPGLYGSGGQTLVAGQGRLARPRFRYTGSFTLGLDDNVFTTPFDAQEIPAVTQEVITKPAEPARIEVTVINPQGRGQFFGERPRRVVTVIPAKPAETETVVLVPAVKPEPRTVSVVARTNVGYEVQFATRRSVFTMDANGSSSFYTNRPGDQVDVNGGLNFAYLYRLTPRMIFSAAANLAYLSQPDFRRINTPQTNTGDYFNGTVKADLTYRWTKRFSTVTSISANSTYYMENVQQTGSFYDTVIGTEARYQVSPRLTALGEVRVSQINYPDDELRQSTTFFFLTGGEMALSRRINASARFGVQFRSFEATGETGLSPYVETTIGYRYGPAGTISWNTRLGYEESPDIFTSEQVLRTGINVAQAFSARLRATGGFSVVSRLSSRDELLGGDYYTTSLSIDAGMEYTLSRNLTLTGSYNFLGNLTSLEGNSYIRNQIFFGVQYAF